MAQLPNEYLEQMNALLKEEYPAFLATYEEPPSKGLRVNTLKIGVEEFLQRVPFRLEPIPWCGEGFYFEPEEDRPGKHVYHAAGLYYIQEPSAMAPVVALDPRPGERVLDLCAAPGGKTTQIAARMRGQGLLVANEIDPRRVKVLVENLDRLGVSHAVVLTESPRRLSRRFVGFFDRILVDAPCSGEGMFRKDPDVCGRWSPRATRRCADVQLEILEAAAAMLRPGGRLTYSTCTFNPVENEEVILRFLEQHPEFELKPVPQAEHYREGRPDWVDGPSQLARSARLWPHHLRGEGHFVAVMEKTGGPEGTAPRPGAFPPVSADAKNKLKQFARETLAEGPPDGPFTLYGDHLYLLPGPLPTLKGLKVERPGCYLGQVKKGRFVPSHSWSMTLTPDRVKRAVSFAEDSPELHRYLRGETLPHSGEKGWVLVTVDRFPLGWGKISGGMLKNHFPKWLRWD